MSLKVHFSALSLSASVDQQTGVMSVFDVLEEIRAPKVPIALPSLVIALSMEKLIPEAFEGEIFIHHVLPSGQNHKVGSGGLKTPANQRRVKAVFRFGGFPIVEYGRHRIVVSWTNQKSEKIGEEIFDFDVLEVPAANQPKSDSENDSSPNGYTH